MQVKQMHLMRVREQQLKNAYKKKHSTPLAKEIERRREEIIHGIIGNAPEIVSQQMRIADMDVIPGGKDNEVILRASNSLLDRAFGKPKESIDFTGNVEFSLKALAQKRKEVPNQLVPLEELV